MLHFMTKTKINVLYLLYLTETSARLKWVKRSKTTFSSQLSVRASSAKSTKPTTKKQTKLSPSK